MRALMMNVTNLYIKVIWLSLQFVSVPYILNPLNDLASLKFSSLLEGMQSTCPCYINSRSQVGQGRGIYPCFLCPLHIFLTLWAIKFIMCRTCNTALHATVKVTLQGHVNYPSMRVHSLYASPESIERFSVSFIQMFFHERWCAELITQLPKLKVKVMDLSLNFVFTQNLRSHLSYFHSLHPNFPLSQTMCSIKQIVQ